MHVPEDGTGSNSKVYGDDVSLDRLFDLLFAPDRKWILYCYEPKEGFEPDIKIHNNKNSGACWGSFVVLDFIASR